MSPEIDPFGWLDEVIAETDWKGGTQKALGGSVVIITLAFIIGNWPNDKNVSLTSSDKKPSVSGQIRGQINPELPINSGIITINGVSFSPKPNIQYPAVCASNVVVRGKTYYMHEGQGLGNKAFAWGCKNGQRVMNK
ncbi:MAG: hypothetical protein V1858_04405 [Candidatus Gottesmanbacteria bacterium]